MQAKWEQHSPSMKCQIRAMVGDCVSCTCLRKCCNRRGRFIQKVQYLNTEIELIATEQGFFCSFFFFFSLFLYSYCSSLPKITITFKFQFQRDLESLTEYSRARYSKTTSANEENRGDIFGRKLLCLFLFVLIETFYASKKDQEQAANSAHTRIFWLIKAIYQKKYFLLIRTCTLRFSLQ